MAKITKRLVKGSPLTYVEGDDNFEILERVSTLLYVSNSYSANVNEMVVPDNSSSSATVTLPASPEDGDFVVVKQGKDQPVTTNSIIIGRNGNDIEGLSEDLTIDIDDRIWMFSYESSSTNWSISIVGNVGGTP